MGRKKLVGLYKLLWNDTDVAYNSYIIGIASPAGDNMDVQVFGNACAGSSAKIQADIKTVRTEHLAENTFTAGREFEQIGTLGRSQIGQRGDMPIRDHHEMAVIVWILIQEYKGRAATPQNVVLCVTLLGWLLTKYAASVVVFIGQNIGHAPRGPYDLTHASPPTWRYS
jgi:hypothetical protein